VCAVFTLPDNITSIDAETMLNARAPAKDTYDEGGAKMYVARHCLMPYEEFTDRIGTRLEPGFEWDDITTTQAITHHPHSTVASPHSKHAALPHAQPTTRRDTPCL
jgi:hypothetical protein